MPGLRQPSPSPDIGVQSVVGLFRVGQRATLVRGVGAARPAIARELHLSESTVKTHVGRAFAKIGARDRVQAVIIAYDIGLVGPRG